MKLLLLLLLSLMTGCEAEFEVKACAPGWVQFICRYPKINTTYQDIDVFIPSQRTIQSFQKDVWENKGRLSLYHDTKNKNLKVVIKPLERDDFGEYRCEFYQRSNSSPDVQTRKLESENCKQPFTQTVYRTVKTSITCDYPRNNYTFFCKENSFTCEDILSAKSPLKSNRTFTLTDTSSGFKVSISDVSSQHAGVYWCGVESNDGNDRVSIRQIKLEIKEPQNRRTTHSATSSPTFTPSATVPESFVPVSSTSTVSTSTSGSAESDGVSKRVIAVIVCVAVQLFLIVFILIYKRFSCSKNRGTSAALQHIKEDCIYEEIQERLQQPDSKTAMNSIYVTANLPTSPDASPHYDTINFQSLSDKAGGETLKPSACEHSAVKVSKSPTNPTVTQPSRPTEEPLYSVINEPQKI